MKERGGFTLIEVMVALTIASSVVIAAHQIFAGVADGSKAIADARGALDRTSNGRRWLKAAFLSLEPPFDGRANRMSFTSWQDTPGGWFRPKSVVLTLEQDRLTAHAADQSIDLREGATDVAFDYLLEPGADTKWVREWVSPVSAPLAIRLRIGGCGKRDAGCVDTLLFLVKERG
jgi:prepilin-type N-terminal cleavage/methylation domain-containing protein